MENRTPKRHLLIGNIKYAGIDTVSWEAQTVPNIADYDTVIISVPHITKQFLERAQGKFFEDIAKALLRFLNSKGKMIVLALPKIEIKRTDLYPGYLSNLSWCPLLFSTIEESGKSVVNKKEMYPSYLKKMTSWSFYFSIPQACLSRELTNYHGATSNTQYRVPLEPYLENRYGRVLAGSCHIEIRRERLQSRDFGGVDYVYPDSPDHITGEIVLLPLLDGILPEEALAHILKDEFGLLVESVLPDWASEIEMPFVPELEKKIAEASAVMAGEEKKITEYSKQIDKIKSYQRLLYGTGYELEDVVRTSLEYLGAKVNPAKYAQEEYVLEIDGKDFLIEVKGIGKSITLTHLRQLTDYLLKYQEDTGKDCKGILFGNAWRLLPPGQRGTEETPEFPENVVRRAEQLNISLVSSRAFFDALMNALRDRSLSQKILEAIISGDGVVTFS
jgi:hypothetical protein